MFIIAVTDKIRQQSEVAKSVKPILSEVNLVFTHRCAFAQVVNICLSAFNTF